MNHNPENLQLRETVILDKGFNNESTVIIVDFTDKKLIATIRSFGETNTWEVMTSRLTKIKHTDGK